MVFKIEIISQEIFFSIWQISEIVRKTSVQVGNQMGIKWNVWQIRVKEG
jgi:hypothetical protein